MRDVDVGLADPLHALDRRVGVLHRRLPAHVPRADVRLATASRASWSGSSACCIFLVPDGRGVLRLPAAVGQHVVLGRAGDRQPVRRDPGDRRRTSSMWIRGDYVVSDITLNRFFAFHVIAMPLVLLRPRRRAPHGAARGRARTTPTASRSRSSKDPTATRSTASRSIRTTRCKDLVGVVRLPDRVRGGRLLRARHGRLLPRARQLRSRPNPLKTPRAHRAGVVLHAVLRDAARGSAIKLLGRRA